MYVTSHVHGSLILGAISLIFVCCLTQIKFISLTGLCTVCTGVLQDVMKSTAMVHKMEKNTSNAIEELE